MDFNPGTLLCAIQNDILNQKLTGYRIQAGDALIESLFKKWLPKDTHALETVAIDGFLTSNARCQAYSVHTGYASDPDFREFMTRMKMRMYDIFQSGPLQTNVLTLDASLQRGRAGPGASRLTKHTDFFHKMFCGPLSASSMMLYHHYKAGISPRWQMAELARSALYQVDIIDSSKLSTVPKNAKTNRTICTEPSLNMFYQLGAGSIIEELLSKFHDIDLSLQPDRNRELARIGSITGDFATIDLSSASDTISMSLVKELLPPGAFGTLRDIRSQYTECNGEKIELGMISSMGNGFTFPLQTMIFATLVTTAYQMLGITPIHGKYRNYSVFGDDIICVRSAYDLVCRMLTCCGFIVNSEKSYNTGSFRESCGQDFYEGHDIRGVYLRKIENEQDLFSAFNRLCRWSAKHYIDIPTALSYLKGLVEFRPVPYDAGDGEGIKCPTDYIPTGVLKSDRNGAKIYRATVVRTYKKRISPICLHYHFDGGMISAIGGYVRGHSVTPRTTDVKLKVVKRRTPRWDYVTDAGLTIRDYLYIWSLL